MALLLLFLCFIMGCCSSYLIKYVSNLMASSSSSLIEYVSNLTASFSSSFPSPPPSSSHDPQMKYDVFISFRGSDIRRGFLSHLKKELQKEIDVYVDERLERGDEISSALLQAIEASEISLIIFSKDYAASKWCLEELVKIMECKELNIQTVIPVFYNIDPSDVRHQRGTYEDAFVQHEQKLKDNTEKVQNWRSAVNKAANLSGYHYSSNFENESKLIDEIRKDVLEKLSFISPVETKSLVGIDQSISYIESLLVSKPKGVQVIGIWGIGGIGKTTLARAVFDKLSPQYQSCCFLENVREETEKNGWSYLLNKLLSELLGEENSYKHCTARAKSSLIKRKLSRTKIFIVLDDVTTGEQLEYLAKELNCLGSGSRVIITSRDKHVLNVYKVNAIYEVKELNFQESLKLFSLNAFNQSYPRMGFEELSKSAVDYTKGIPLALKVLGSHFHSRNKETWNSALQRLHKYPNEKIQNVLKVSYDGLQHVEQEIFLDIVFFFKGECKDDVIRVLDACGFYGACGIDNLVDKALITISNHNKIEMHDLIQDMGEQIVREEYIKHPEKRSRLNDTEEIYGVLKHNKGTHKVEGISYITDVKLIRDVELSADTFKKMPNLRILKFRFCNVKLPFGLESFSDNLRYLSWDEYPLKSLPLNFCTENLVELDMKFSKLIKLWEGVQDLVNLKSINLSYSSCLLELPDFSRARNLEKVNLSWCASLCNVHPSILSLHSLVTLDLYGCEKLKSLQSEIHLKSLKDLDIGFCFSLEKFSLSSEKLTALQLYNRIEILGSSIGRLSKLRSLSLTGTELRILPINDLCRLTYLQELVLIDFGQVIDKGKLHILFDSLHSLKELHLKKCSYMYELPDNISALSCLRSLHLSESNIESLPASIKLPSLEELYLEECSNLSELPEDISGLSSLQTLSLERSGIKSLPASIKHLSNLKTMNLKNCEKLQFVPELPPFIADLDAYNCTSLETVLTATTFALQQDAEMHYLISFQNCKRLDGPSLIKFVQFWVKRLVYDNVSLLDICYPGNRVPEWFEYQQIGTTITIELASPLDDLKGFILCLVPLSCFSEAEIGDYYELHCRCYFEDGEEVEVLEVRRYPFIRLNWDHVSLRYEPFEYEDLLEEVKWRRENGEGITYNSKLSFKFSAKSGYHFFRKPVKRDDLIKAWGVCPIYASENHNFLQQMELKMRTKRRRDIDEQQLLPPAKRFLSGIYHPCN